MGQEIVYCVLCQTQLRSADFEKGNAFKFGLDSVCKKCAPEAVKSLPPEKIQALLKSMEAVSPGKPLPDVQAPAANPRKGTARIPLATPPSGQKAAPESPSGAVIGLAAAGGGLLLLIAIFTLSSTKPTGPVSTKSSKPPAEVAVNGPPETQITRPPIEEAGTQAARDALEKARRFAQANPMNLDGQTALYADAVRLAENTPYYGDATRSQKALATTIEATLSRERAQLDEQALAELGREDFRSALAVVEQARKSHGLPEWIAIVDRKSTEIRKKAEVLYAPLKRSAADAQQKGALDEVKAIREHVSKWGLENLVSDLDRHLSTLVTKRPPSPESQAYRTRWEESMTRAFSRDYETAIAQLERAASEFPAQVEIRKEAASDQEIIRSVVTLRREGLQLLPSLPKGEKLTLEYVDDPTGPKSVTGWVVQAGLERVELRRDSKEKETVFVEWSDLTTGGMARLLKGRAGNASENKDRALALLCLFEGDADQAMKVVGDRADTIPEKYWSFAKGVRESAPKPDPKEFEARQIFHVAELDWRGIKTRGSALEKYRALQKDFEATSFVRRNREMIESRLEAGKEYVFFPTDLRGAGSFRLSENPKMKLCWSSQKDVDSSSSKDNYVEVEFHALPGTAYRCWAYVGACCTETFAFYYQTTEGTAPNPKQIGQTVSLEPGGSTAMPVDSKLMGLKKDHATHGGPKEPSRWAWVEIPLPSKGYAAPGPKSIRLISDQKGFSVGYILVSSRRRGAPTEADTKGMAKDFENIEAVLDLVITDLKVTSGKAYEWFTLGAGEKVYIDRAFTYSPIPAIVNGAMALRTANDDKRSTGDSFLSFHVNQEVTVYVAQDTRFPKPEWMASFRSCGKDLEFKSKMDDCRYDLLSRDFRAGTVTLGGASPPGVAGTMYTVVVVPKNRKK
jgi:hypothetical protein